MKRFTPLKHPIYAERVDLAFELRADLRPLFHWNTKQVFAYVVAEYETETHEINHIVIWDKIIRTDCTEVNERLPHLDTWCPDDPRLLRGGEIYNKYHLLHPRKQLRENDVKLSLHYDIMPIVGAVFPTSMPASWFNDFTRRTKDFVFEFAMPADYTFSRYVIPKVGAA